jgi:hypothetical protein
MADTTSNAQICSALVASDGFIPVTGPQNSLRTPALPTEMLVEIFKSFFEQTLQEYDQKFPNLLECIDVPLILGSVCTQWRQIVLEVPFLWTFIQVPFDICGNGGNSTAKKVLKRRLERSGSYSLRLLVTNFVQGKPQPLALFFPFNRMPLDRIKHLTIILPNDTDIRFEVYEETLNSFDDLTSFELIGRPHKTIFLQKSINHHTPLLRSLRLYACQPSCDPLLSPDNQIETLCLVRVDDMDDRIWDLNVPNIRSFHLGSQSRGSFRVRASDTSITHLILEDMFLAPWRGIFDGPFKALTHLAIRNDQFRLGAHVHRFIKLVGHTITHLELTNVAWNRMPWEFFFIHVVLLRHFKLCQSNSRWTGPLLSVFASLMQPIVISRNKFEDLSCIQIVLAPHIPSVDSIESITRFIGSLHDGQRHNLVLRVTPNVFNQRDVQSMSAICNLLVEQATVPVSSRIILSSYMNSNTAPVIG